MFTAKFLATVVTGIGLVISAGQVLAQRGGNADIPDEIRALIKREEAKGLVQDSANRKNTNSISNRVGGGNSGGSSGCSLEVGNVNNAGKGAAPRQVTTVITGPVIQMNNKCD